MYVAVGQLCGQCQVEYGGECLPCPEGSKLPACVGCSDDEPWLDKREIASAVVTGLVTAILLGVITAQLSKMNVKVK